MREILLSHIKVYRYQHSELPKAAEHLITHKLTCGHMGCLLFPECNYSLGRALPEKVDREIAKADSPHYLFKDSWFETIGDQCLVDAVLRRFPMYNEDDDPLIDAEEPLTLKAPGFRPTPIIPPLAEDVDRYIHTMDLGKTSSLVKGKNGGISY